MDQPKKPSEFPINTIPELVRKKADKNSDDVAIIEESTDKTFTFLELDQQSDEIAAALHERGIGSGDTVTTIMSNSIDHVLLWFGCMKLGAIFASMNTGLQQDDLQSSLEAIAPSMTLVDEDYLEQYGRVRDTATTGKEVVRGSGLSGADRFESLFEVTKSPPDVRVEPDDSAIILFTGGSTGTPKPVLHPQFAPISGAYRYRESYDVRPDDRHLGVLKLFHIGGQQFSILGPLFSDISTVLVDQFSASKFFDQVNEYDATLLDLLGGMWGALLNTHDTRVENSARVSLGVMEPRMYNDVIERFGIGILEGYALTECGGILLTSNSVSNTAESTMEGKPVGNTGEWATIGILDKEGAEVPTGEKGEICIRPTIPNTMMERYYGYLEATIDSWEGLWIHTGDIGYMDDDGVLYYVGRHAHWIRRFGENISSKEIENLLNDHPAVIASAAVGVSNRERGDEDVAVFVQVQEEVMADELIEWCSGRIAEFKIPRYVEFIDSFPRSETKETIERHELRDRGIRDAWDRTKNTR